MFRNLKSMKEVLNPDFVCNHKPSIGRIWGPLGTGRTTTVCMLLLTLFRLNCRILTCALTNVAITELASRVQNLVKGSFERENERRFHFVHLEIFSCLVIRIGLKLALGLKTYIG